VEKPSLNEMKRAGPLDAAKGGTLGGPRRHCEGIPRSRVPLVTEKSNKGGSWRALTGFFGLAQLVKVGLELRQKRSGSAQVRPYPTKESTRVRSFWG
jgi:hypothetical protein